MNKQWFPKCYIGCLLTSYLECYVIDLTWICLKLKLKLHREWCKLELVQLIISVYPLVVMEVWFQCLGLPALMG